MLLSQTRIFLGMAKDGLLPHKMFGYIHPKFKTPARSTVLVGGIVSVVSAVTPINNLAEMTSIGTLLAFAMISAAVWMLRVKEPNLHRPFKVPALPVVASLGVLFNVAMMISLKDTTWIRLIVWVAIGLLIYFLYSYKNSKLNNTK
jgi:APA family basic amino acid/polyamine antiporter